MRTWFALAVVLATLAACATATPVATTAAAPSKPAANPEVPVELVAAAKAPAATTAGTPPVAEDVGDKKMVAAMKDGKSQDGASNNATIRFQVLPPLLPKCESNKECVELLGEHSSCGEDHWCVCAEGSQYDGAFSKKCLLSRKNVGESCKEQGDCKLANSYCKAGGCHCAKGYVFSDDMTRCLPVATEANPTCEEARQCVILLKSSAGPTGPAVCVEGKCHCRYDHQLLNGTCVLKKGELQLLAAPPRRNVTTRGKACSQDGECEDLVGGACMQGVCGCKAEYVPAVAANKCLPVVRALAALCDEDIQCSEGLGDLSRCVASQCACADGAVLADNKKCECVAGEMYSRETARCEKSAPGNQEAIKEPQSGGGGGASGVKSSLTFVVLITSWAICKIVS